MNMKLLLFCLVFVVQQCSSSHVLVLELMGAKSHRITMMPIVKGLAERHHRVTIVSPNKWSELIENVHEIQIPSVLADCEGVIDFNWFEINEVDGRKMKSISAFKNLVYSRLKPMFINLMDCPGFNQMIKKSENRPGSRR